MKDPLKEKAMKMKYISVIAVIIMFPSFAYAACPYDYDCLDNPYGAGNPYKSDGLMNPYSEYGSKYSNKSWRNP